MFKKVKLITSKNILSAIKNSEIVRMLDYKFNFDTITTMMPTQHYQ
jgi:hypothetical protein